MKAIDYLDRFEADLLEFYANMGEFTPPDKTRLYALLSDTRKLHLAEYNRMKASLGSAMASEIPDSMEECGKICRLTPMDMARMRRRDTDGYMHVMAAEELLLGRCAELAEQSRDERERELLNWFMADEMNQLREIEEIYEFMEAPQCYLAWGEFSNLRTL
jgi:hypothetical protein